MKDWQLQHPDITYAERTGYPPRYDEIPPMRCEDCGDLIDDYDLDAFIGFETCICGKCWKEFHAEEDE